MKNKPCPKGEWKELQKPRPKKRRTRKKLVARTCKHCGSSYEARDVRQTYCTPTCLRDARNDRDRKGRRPGKSKCKHCKIAFTQRTAWQQYCGDVCSEKARQLRRGMGMGRKKAAMLSATCAICGKEFQQPRRFYEKIASRRTPKYCSIECTYKARRGQESPKWRGGTITYRGARWLQTAAEARARDGNLCGIVACGKLPKNRSKHHVDHIVPFRLMKSWGMDPNSLGNLLTLCNSCHAKKTPIEDRLLRGDVIGFLRELVELGYPEASIRCAFGLAGLSTNGL